MAESGVTVVHCRTCRRSADLALLEGRFWCGWCQDWAEVAAERADRTAIVRDGAEARLVPIPPLVPPRQPLRIPAGWLLLYNEFYEVAPSAEWTYRHEVLMARNEDRGRLMDLSWRLDEESSEWGFRLAVWSGDWDELLHSFRSRDREAVVTELERLFSEIMWGRL